MKRVYIFMGLVLLGGSPVFSQSGPPGNNPGFPFRYYNPPTTDSLQSFSFPKGPGPFNLAEKMDLDFSFKNWDLKFHSAMPTFKPLLRDKMPVVKPDSTVKYHLRIKPITGGQIYK
jgi:hypothetical protein